MTVNNSQVVQNLPNLTKLNLSGCRECVTDEGIKIVFLCSSKMFCIMEFLSVMFNIYWDFFLHLFLHSCASAGPKLSTPNTPGYKVGK